MRPYLLLAFLLISFSALSQISQEETECSRSKDILGNQGINYYQFPSMNKYDVKYIKLDLAVETGTRFISGNALTVVRAVATLDSFITELKSTMIVDSVFINGAKLTFTHNSDHIYIPVSPALPPGSAVNALIYYHGTAGSGGVFTGNVPSNGLNYTATLSESYQAREWFPAKQILSDKIDSADLWFTTSSVNKVGSNGLLQSVVPMPGGKSQYRWKTRYPMNYYLLSFSTGNYMEYLNYAKPLAMAPDSIPIQHYIVNNPTYFASIKPNLDKTPPFIELQSELFGLYPFKNEKYGHAHAGIGGGMEHQTMSTMAGFTSTLIAHELGHQWWGDNVTCATWNHIWLNEGFASYCEYLMIEKLPALIPSTTASAFMQGYQNSVMSQPGGSVIVPDADLYNEGRIFSSRLSYAKGAAVIHTLRFEMQDDNIFFQGLRNYQQQYGNSVATTNDLKQVMEAVSGKNLTDYFNQWIYGQGYPTFNITFLKEGTNTLVLRVNQTTSMPAVTPFFKGLYEFRVTSAQGDTTVKVYLTTNNEEFRFTYTKTPDGVVVDPNNWVLNNTGTITNGGTTIPASEVTLSGNEASPCNISLAWHTISEHNISKYEIEYSKDNFIFDYAGEVAGTNSNVDEDYNFNFVVADQSSPLYFRIKIFDTLGNVRYSNVITVTNTCTLLYTVKVGPVPSYGLLNVIITMPASGNTTIILMNALGETIYKNLHSLIAGENMIQLEIMKQLPPGTYWLRVITNGNKTTKKILRL